MLPGKQYTPEDLARVAARRAWIVILSVAVAGGIALAVSRRLPDQFRSETLIMVIPQRIPDVYVKAAVGTRIEDRLNSLEDQILSRSRLERIILDLDLYGSLRRQLPMEDVVQRMRDNDIGVKVEGKESFRISYVSRDAKTAQKTTERLASLFIEESLRDRENVAEDTNQFLDSQLEDAKRRLVEHEKKLEEYRSRFGGELPSQVNSNLQAMQGARVQLQSLDETADRARERRLLLERQLADLQTEPLVTVAPQTTGSTTPQPIPGESAAQQLQNAQASLDVLLSQYTAEHPYVRALKRTINELQAKVAEEAARPPVSDATASVAPKAVSPAERQRQQRIRDIKLQMDDIDRQLAEKQEQEKRLRLVIADYQSKLDAVPKRESDLTELTRDYTTLQASYQSLLVKREEATLARNLARRNIGEQFKVLDPPLAPERPFKPNRRLIDLGGAGAGLALGVLLVALLEYRDSSFKNDDEVVRVLNVRVLAQVPLMISDAERRTRKWRIALIGVGVLMLAGSGAALAMWRLRF